MKHYVTVFLLFASLHLGMGAQLPEGFVEQLIAGNLDPTDMVIADDGRLFITIKSGKILIVQEGVLQQEPFLLLDVDNSNERGLGHMVLDPDFEQNNYYYVYYTVPGQNFNRVSRFTANGNFTTPGSELILLDLDPLAGSIHNAGDMVFGQDGKLYISVGDGANSANAQSFNNLLGKILRINADGSIPSDNPFFSSTAVTGKNKAIWALGLRNPFSMDMQLGTGRIFVSEVGASAFEEINEILPGKNYGWPGIEGMRTTQPMPLNYKDPIFVYPHGDGLNAGCAVVGAAFYNPATPEFPQSYLGKFFFGDFCNGYIKALDPATNQAEVFITGINRPLAILTAPDGSLYYLARAGLGGGSEQDNTASNNGTLWKVNYTGSGIPSVSVQPMDVLVPVGEAATFTVAASGTQPITYQWQENSVDIPGATASSYTVANAMLADEGKLYRCRVGNSIGSTLSNSATLHVTTNTRPVPVILDPVEGSTYAAGDMLVFSGSATDAEDGLVPASSLSWKIDFHHDMHTHPALPSLPGVEGSSFAIPRVGETSANVWYRVYLTATDQGGLSKTTYRDVLPRKGLININTKVAGLKINLDGQLITTPAAVISVVGLTRTVEAPLLQSNEGGDFLFSKWEDGKPRLFAFDVPEGDVSFLAEYDQVPQGNGTGLTGFYFNKQDMAFNGPPTFIRTDPTINFNWGTGSPVPGIIDNDIFTVQWVGEVLPQFSEKYTFFFTSDDGVRLWVNDQLLIDKWIPQAATEWSGDIDLAAETKYPIRIEYFEAGGEAVARLAWKSSSLPKQVISAKQLSADVVTGLPEENYEANLMAYPTLASRTLNIVTTEEWTIIDLLGRSMATGMGAAVVEVGTWAPGLYVVRSKSGGVTKFIRPQ